MSKRETEEMKLTGQSIFIKDLAELGYLPEAVVNWIALMGWGFDDHTEFFTMQDLIEKFDIAKLNPSPAAIDFKKLDHFNGLHIRALPVKELTKRLMPYFEKANIEADPTVLAKIAPIIQIRMATLDEAPELAGFFFRDEITVAPESVVIKGLDAAQSAAALRKALEILEVLPEFTAASAEEPMRAVAEELGLKAGQLFTALRNAVTGQEVTPPLFESMEIIGREKVLTRLQAAVAALDGLSKSS
jgi:glutamyl-tRNA synthetase